MREASSLTVLFQVLPPLTERLDRFLADQLAMSRTQAARLLGEGAVQVNGETARASRMLERGDTVEVVIPGEQPRREITPLDLPLTVIFEDDHILVIDKPAGLVVHPAPGHWDDTLVNALAGRMGADSRTGGWADGRMEDDEVEDTPEAGTNDKPPSAYPPIRPSASDRPGIVHRLDKDTSGLLIVAKTESAHRKLSHALGLRRIEREYAALIWGHIKTAQEIDAPIARNPRNRQQMAVVKDGRPAQTLIQPVARYEVVDLVRAKLFTGRTHQIRVHLAHIGHPVVSDPVYGSGGHRRMTGAQHNAALAVERATPRQALHAASLKFAHPETREWLEFHSDWPGDLRPGLVAATGDPTLLARPKVLEYLGFRA